MHLGQQLIWMLRPPTGSHLHVHRLYKLPASSDHAYYHKAETTAIESCIQKSSHGSADHIAPTVNVVSRRPDGMIGRQHRLVLVSIAPGSKIIELMRFHFSAKIRVVSLALRLNSCRQLIDLVFHNIG
jgi:hypothetical protein